MGEAEKGVKKEKIRKVIHFVVFANLGLLLSLYCRVKPVWESMQPSPLAAPVCGADWYGIVPFVAWFFFCLYGAGCVLFLFDGFFGGKLKPFLNLFWFLHLPVFLVFNGLMAVMIYYAGGDLLLSSLGYLYREYRLPYLVVLALFHGWLSVKLFLRSRGAPRGERLRNLAGSAGTAFAVCLFVYKAVQHIRGWG